MLPYCVFGFDSCLHMFVVELACDKTRPPLHKWLQQSQSLKVCLGTLETSVADVSASFRTTCLTVFMNYICHLLPTNGPQRNRSKVKQVNDLEHQTGQTGSPLVPIVVIRDAGFYV